MSETPECFFNGVFDVCLPRRPYPGLRPFEKEEWPIFFGRERMADAVVAQLIDKRLLVVHGDSGCGKSSLVRAAVLPRLEQESARSGLTWRTCTTLPGDAPLWNFAAALAALDGGDEARTMEIRRALNFGRDAPTEIARLMRRDPTDHLCILVDQFEELFDFARRNGAEEAQTLVDFLIALFESPPPGLYAVLTMRSEFLGACARFRGFAETVNATQYLLPRMTHEDLLRAIREPALLFDGEISAELAEQLIHDAAGGQDQLPLIQHGLMLLYRDRVELAPESKDSAAWRLGIEAYDRSKGLAGLLSEHADAVMAIAQARLADNSAKNSGNNAQNSAHSRVVEDMFRALTDINADGHAIRRPQTLATLAAVAGCSEEQLRLVIDPFRVDGVSLLRPLGAEPLAADERIDISHEALIRSWQRLADPAEGWLVREFRNGLVWRALLVQADSFDRDPTNVLGPTTTEERLVWIKRRNPAWAERYGGGWERVQRLLGESAIARDRDLAEQEAALRMEELANQRAQRMRTLYRGLTILGLLVAVTVTMSVVAWRESVAARRDRQFAQEQLGIAQSARSREAELRIQAEALLAEAQKTIGALGRVQEKLGKAASETNNVELAETLYQAQGTINKQVDNLNKRATFGSKSAASTIKPSATTVYIHIADERQRPQAERFARLLAETDLGGSPPQVPGIELVKSSPARSELRCFRVEECRGLGERLTKVANSLLGNPNLALADLSGRYGSAGNIQPSHFEVWFAAEDIRLHDRDYRQTAD